MTEPPTLTQLLDAYGAASGLKLGVRDAKAWPALVARLVEDETMRQQARDIISSCTDALIQRDWISKWKKTTLEGALPKGIR